MIKVRLTAIVSEEANTQLERYANAHGLKKGALIEQALLHHLQALRELPAGIIVGGNRRALHPAEMSEESVKAHKSERAPAAAAAVDDAIKTKHRRRR